MFAAFAFCITARKRAFVSGLGPPSFTAITMSLPILVNVLAIADQRFNFLAFLNSNALPISCFYNCKSIYLCKNNKKTTFFKGNHVKSPYEKNSNCYVRSEEHTSELQSRPHLVCRLLLEKKKKKKNNNKTN